MCSYELKYIVGDVSKAAEYKFLCGVYASAVLAKTSFEHMLEWYKNNVFTSGIRGVQVEEVEKCLREHSYTMEKVTICPGKLHKVAKLTCLSSRPRTATVGLKPNENYLFVFESHVAVFGNNMMNERGKGGWIEPIKCQNRDVREVYLVRYDAACSEWRSEEKLVQLHNKRYRSCSPPQTSLIITAIQQSKEKHSKLKKKQEATQKSMEGKQIQLRTRKDPISHKEACNMFTSLYTSNLGPDGQKWYELYRQLRTGDVESKTIKLEDNKNLWPYPDITRENGFGDSEGNINLIDLANDTYDVIIQCGDRLEEDMYLFRGMTCLNDKHTEKIHMTSFSTAPLPAFATNKCLYSVKIPKGTMYNIPTSKKREYEVIIYTPGEYTDITPILPNLQDTSDTTNKLRIAIQKLDGDDEDETLLESFKQDESEGDGFFFKGLNIQKFLVATMR